MNLEGGLQKEQSLLYHEDILGETLNLSSPKFQNNDSKKTATEVVQSNKGKMTFDELKRQLKEELKMNKRSYEL